MRLISLLTFAIMLISNTGNAKSIKLCVEERNWYPFTYFKNSQPQGMHIDITKKALTNLGYDEIIICGAPRIRCLQINAKHGRVDGIISVVYDSDFKDYIIFPQKQKIMQVDHLVITYTGSSYEFEGDLKTLPQPVRVISSETSFIDRLKNVGLNTEAVKNDVQNFDKLMRDQIGSVITTSLVAEKMNEDKRYQGRFEIQATPFSSDAYLLVFSQKSKISRKEMTAIWNEIEKLRHDYVYMLQIFAQY